jgi:predicted nucleotidyltransferase component of viral defense system
VKEPVNLAASIRQRLLNEAKRRDESFDYIASLYARERFIARLAVSSHSKRLVLKGATVFTLWLDSHRATRDLDFLGLGDFGVEEAASVIREIIAIELADGLQFDVSSVAAEGIRERDEYHGVRVQLSAILDSARIRMQIDIGVGDVVTPPAKTAALPVVLPQFPPPRVKVYPPETIIAEKLHAMVKLGVANSRMKDFFDVYVLASLKEFDGELLATAVARTFKRRRTAIPMEPFALTEEFYRDRQKQTQWRAFVNKSGIEAPLEFPAIGERLRAFLQPVLDFTREQQKQRQVWRSQQWRKND